MALICHCQGVNERKIAKAISKGAQTVAEVQAACGAGTRCGGCIPAIQELLDARPVGVGVSVRVLAHAG